MSDKIRFECVDWKLLIYFGLTEFAFSVKFPRKGVC